MQWVKLIIKVVQFDRTNISIPLDFIINLCFATYFVLARQLLAVFTGKVWKT